MPTPSPTRILGLAIVVRTGSGGVYMHSLPSIAPETRTELWKDGTRLEILGEEMEAAGRRWLRVKDPKGGVGFITTEYLVTATPTRTPVVTPTPSPTAVPPTATLTPTTRATPPPATPTATPTVAPSATATPVPPTQTPKPLPTAVATQPGSPTPAPTTAVPTISPTATINAVAAQIEVVSTTESRSTAFVTIEGYARNISNGSFENVQVIVQYYGVDGTPVSRGSAAISSSLLGPGQSSYFKVLVPVEVGMSRFAVFFADQAGRPIPSVDRR